MSVRRLQEFKTYYICPDHNDKYHERKLHMDKLLADMGFTNVHHYKSGTEGYPACLNRANIDILRSNLDEPVLILEDDVDTTGMCEFIMPEGVDTIYFGLSARAGSRTHNWDEGWAQVDTHSLTQVRVHNMLAAHAILYVSRAYKEKIIETYAAHMNTPYHTDVLASRLHPQFMILANRVPTFWQANRFNAPRDMEKDTKIMFSYPTNQIHRF